MVNLFFEDTEVLDYDPEFFVLWLSKVVAAHEKQLGELNLIFCSDEYLLEMNREHLQHDYYTDIITFDYCVGEFISGDLFISIDRVKENATIQNEMFHVELCRVVVHGVLHLVGYKDKSDTDEREMRRQEALALDLLVPRET
ncbi:MAG: rRNA maturation RNase YbeY [Bacteroidetes bacterium RIFCSPHIGHO2_02_FULL_44_7]|nr:MAG: rRNA maturation RNase YbeY [Bacteroidetes bacterium RIFCSPHIGHO2_02_FULL_44_7]